jgi:hypothetical protein
VSDPLADLEHELRADVPPGIAALPPEQIAHLASSVREQRHAQLAAADEAIENGLGFLPRVLRMAVRKALIG